MRSFLVSFAFCLLALAAAAQKADTLYLREVTVYGLPVTSYSTGAKVETLILTDGVATLADGLAGEASLYLKNYGNQQLSTIALRGTTASQTSVLWNGININSPTLGQTDFSLIPLFLMDEVSLHYGTASSLYGSDAIGGSIMLGHATPDFKKTFQTTLSQQAGSFGKLSTGIKFSYGGERWQYRTKFYRSYIRNDFPYHSPAAGYRKKQSHASVINYGFDQQVYYKISEDQILSGEIMYIDNDREIQPAVTNDHGNETLENRNLRGAINYTRDSPWGIIHATAAYQFSDQDYIDGETQTVQSSQATAQINADRPIGQRSNVRYGLSYNYYTGTGDHFRGVGEGRYDAFVSYRFAVSDLWIVNLNVRQSLYDQHYAPLSPSLGTEVHALRKSKDQVTLRVRAARGFRVPTLDDRYWIPGGNPLTKPEESFHAETGVRWSRLDETSLMIDATYYQSWIDKMIVWMPDDEGIWSPLNLQKVDIRGAEFSLKTENSSHRIKIKSRLDYSYTQSLNKEAMPGNSAFVNKQLPYVPLHDARASLTLTSRKEWEIAIRHGYTGLRYSALDNDDYQSLEAYQLTDLSLSKKYNFTRWSLEVTAEVKNILDVYYENLKNRAMPGRNYLLSLSIKL